VHFLKDHVKEKNELPDMRIARAVYELRKERMGMVQNPQQYEFVYKYMKREFEQLEKTLPETKTTEGNKETKTIETKTNLSKSNEN